jgi:hypothetical protein
MARLSHSAVSRYLECGKSYEYHYVKKYRSPEQSAALLFGSAIDKATEHYAISVKANKITRKAAKIETINMFNETWHSQDINGTRTALNYCTEIVYGNNDLDLELLDKSDYELINETHDIKDFDSTIADILERKEKVGFKNLSNNDKMFLNHTNWICMSKKGVLMIDAFVKWFDENVIEVLATQKKTELESDDDSVIGFIDLVCRVKGFDKPVILDVKTSARPYEQDSVVKSVQLGGYVFAIKHEFEDTNLAGYIVLQKNIKKNKSKICSVCGYDGSGGTHSTCPNEKVVGIIASGKNKGLDKKERCKGEWDIKINPECVVQYIVDTVPELLQDRVIENYEPIAKGIEAEIFPRNFGSCIKWGVVKCAFYDICHSDSMEGIVIKEDKK